MIALLIGYLMSEIIIQEGESYGATKRIVVVFNMRASSKKASEF